MAKKVLLLLGTKKGAFILESDTERRSWDLRMAFRMGANVGWGQAAEFGHHCSG